MPPPRFPVRRRIRLAAAAYRAGECFFITVGTNGRHPWFSNHPELADQFAAVITSMAEQPDCQVYAWCVMPDHLHLLLQATDVLEFVRLLKGRVTPLARRYEPRRLWQRSFFDHGLRRDEAVADVAQYIFENPVRARLVDAPPDYRWSGSSVWPHWREGYRLPSGPPSGRG